MGGKISKIIFIKFNIKPIIISAINKNLINEHQ